MAGRPYGVSEAKGGTVAKVDNKPIVDQSKVNSLVAAFRDVVKTMSSDKVTEHASALILALQAPVAPNDPKANAFDKYGDFTKWSPATREAAALAISLESAQHLSRAPAPARSWSTASAGFEIKRG